MMRQSIQFSRNAGFSSVYVTTFKGLGAAMSLYAKAGFKIVEKQADETWGRTVLKQRLEFELYTVYFLWLKRKSALYTTMTLWGLICTSDQSREAPLMGSNPYLVWEETCRELFH